MPEVLSSGSGSFFVDGPGGIGKTFLYHSFLATLRSSGHIAITVVSSSVVASIVPGGQTAYSRFKIPLDVSANKICQISKQSSIARLIMLAKLILWHEASMTKKDTIEAFDLLLKNVMDSDKPFGGSGISLRFPEFFESKRVAPQLVLKENCPIILLKNLNPTEGLCNGIRLVCKQLRQHALCAKIAVGQHQGKRVILSRIPLQTSDNEKNGIPFKRTQFPVKLCFAMAINKSQGQTLDRVGIYQHEPVFSHGQLYVALSRSKMASAVKVLIMPPTFYDANIVLESKTMNVVYREILELAAK
nr:uncharacterized protein LOC113696630 [Coffea arabica]